MDNKYSDNEIKVEEGFAKKFENFWYYHKWKVLVSLFALVSCSTFGGIKSNFEKNDYTYIELDEDNAIIKSITAELEEGEITCTMHLFSKNGQLIPKLALVL